MATFGLSNKPKTPMAVTTSKEFLILFNFLSNNFALINFTSFTLFFASDIRLLKIWFYTGKITIYFTFRVI